MKLLQCKLLLLFLSSLIFSCTVIVNKKIKDKVVDGENDAVAELEVEVTDDADVEEVTDTADGEDVTDAAEVEADITEDELDITDVVEFDFNPALCGVWGKITLAPEGVENLDIDVSGGNSDMDGNGEVQFGVLYPDSFLWWWYLNGQMSPLDPPFWEFRFDRDSYYCIPSEFFSRESITEGWISPIMYDAPYSLAEYGNDFLYFQSLVVEPVNFLIAVDTINPDDASFRDLSPIYWDGVHGTELDIELARRVSKFIGVVRFVDFVVSGPDRQSRLCVTVYGKREPGDPLNPPYDAEYLGSTHYDLINSEIEGGSVDYDFTINFAARKHQVFLVHVRYIESRASAELGYPCGLESFEDSCDERCITMGGSVGIEIYDSTPFVIDPIASSPANECDLEAANLCN